MQKALAKNRFTVDELYEQLRGQGITDLASVKYAILETSGKVSILPYTKDSPVTPKAVSLCVPDDVTLPVLLINDGHVMSENLRGSGYNGDWLQKQLKARNITSPREVFLLTVDEAGSVTCVAKEAGA